MNRYTVDIVFEVSYFNWKEIEPAEFIMTDGDLRYEILHDMPSDLLLAIF